MESNTAAQGDEITLASHRRFAAELREARATLRKVGMEATRAYGPRHRIARMAKRAARAVDILRSMLDSELCAGRPELGDKEVAGIYYGTDEQASDGRPRARYVCLADLGGTGGQR